MTLENFMSDLSKMTTMVVGASCGLGRGIATAFAEAGAPVIAVSRTVSEPVDGVRQEVADAGAATAAADLIDRHDPSVVVLVAGATPHMRPLRQQTLAVALCH